MLLQLSVVRQAALVAFLGFGPAMPAAASDEYLVFPEIADFTIGATIGGTERQFRIPADLPAVAALPAKERAAVREDIARVRANNEIIRRVSQKFFASNGMPGDARLTPDYEHELSAVAVSISFADSLLPNPLWRHETILRALPLRSKIDIFYAAPAEARLKKALRDAGLLQRARLHPSAKWSGKKEQISKFDRYTRWTRDTFLTGHNRRGEFVAFLPLAYAQPSDLRHSDLKFVESRWRENKNIVRLPGFLRGGNVMVADNQFGQRVAFVGANEIQHNRDIFWSVMGREPPANYLTEIVKRIAGVKNVVVLPNSKHFFHLDMAMIMLGRGITAVLDPHSSERGLDSADFEVLLAMRQTLAHNGFKIAPIPTTSARIAAFQSPVNILLYRDPGSTAAKAIGATFPDVTLVADGKTASLNALVSEAFAKAGVDMTWVEDRFSDKSGGVHCSIMALD